MKKFYALFIGLLLSLTGFSQSCLPEGIEFSTQAQIDNFQFNFPNCTEIEGGVLINGAGITNLNGLLALTTIGNDLQIGNTSALTCLYGLNNIDSVGGNLAIINNSGLLNLVGLNNILSVGDNVEIRKNNCLTNLIGLDNLTFIGNDLIIGGENYGNPALLNLTGLGALSYIGGKMAITFNNAITNLIGLENLETIVGDIHIADNDSLTNLMGLQGLTSTNGYLYISFNDALTDLTGLNNLISVGGNFSINRNDNLNSLTGLESLNSIEGKLSVYDNPITTLTALGSLTNIGGYLNISYDYPLNSLTGLENLTNVGGDLIIEENSSLSDLTALNGLTSIGGYLMIASNDNLTSLSGLDNIDAATINGLVIQNHSSLCNCEIESICEYLANPSGVVDVWNNGNVAGCRNPLEIASACGITLPCLPYGNYYFLSQADIDNFQTNYPACTDLRGNVNIFGVGENDITNLYGLSAVTLMEGALVICTTDLLTSLSGLDNITGGSILELNIFDNASLSTCEIQSVCDYLASPNGNIEIHDNATGCNSPEEVEAACGVGLEENSTSDSHVSIFPNPTSTAIIISLPSTTTVVNTTLSIYNVNAQQVNSRRITEPITVLDIGTLPRGVYIVRVSNDRTVLVSKFIKQ